MANLFDAISDNSQAIDRATLAGLHYQKNVWDYLVFTKSDFVALHSLKKMPFYLNFISIM